jgi:putative addiction module CopG family antidote
MSLTLPPELEAFVQARVASGAYASEQDVLRTAFTLLEKRESLLAHIDEGTLQLRSGQYKEYGEADRDRFLADIAGAASRASNSGE